jgi:hypothetical protein
MRSSLTIAKRWEESGNSLTTTFSNEKNLDTKNTSTVLPSMRFRRPRKALFGKQDTRLQRRKYMTQDTAEKKEAAWYEAIYYTFDADFKNTGEKRFDTVQPTPGVLDTVEVSPFNREMNMSTGLSSSFKFMGWLVSEPSLQLSENFAASNKYIADEQYRRNDNFSARLGLGTTVYGTFNPSIGRLKGVRHVIIPSVSYTYGKRRSFFAENSEAFLRFDKNDLEKGRVNGMNINLRNLLQVKTVNKEKENKFDLFALNFSSSVDFEKDKRPVSPLLTTLDFTPLKQFMTTRLSASHDFYHDDDSFHLFSPYLTNFTITTNVGLSQTNLAFMSRSSREYSSSNLGRDDFSLQEEIGTERSGAEETGGSMRFDLKFSHMYQIRRSGKDAHGKYKYITSHNIKPTVAFSPTINFSVNYYLYYDIEEKHLIFHRLIINRDLHCWEANISWIPSGVNEGYYFKINIKDLPDIKIEKRRGTSQTSY